MNKGGNPPGGFTIVETLIVLAVTGLLFVSAAVVINGRQQKTEFMVGLQSVKQQLQETINETASGTFPSSDNFKCSKGNPPVLSDTADVQGTNFGCIFVGKIIQFSPSPDPNVFNIFTLAGNQYDNATGLEVSSVDAAAPQAVAPSSSQPFLTKDLTDVHQLSNALTVQSLTYQKVNPGIGNINTAAFGFVPNLGEVQYNGGGLSSGSQRLDLYAVKTTSLGETKSGLVSDIDFQPTKLDAAKEVDLCLSGGNGQSGLIVINANGSQLAVTLQIKGNNTCA